MPTVRREAFLSAAWSICKLCEVSSATFDGHRFGRMELRPITQHINSIGVCDMIADPKEKIVLDGGSIPPTSTKCRSLPDAPTSEGGEQVSTGRPVTGDTPRQAPDVNSANP